MQKVELSCPNCGAADSAPSQHGSRVCRFCGTHFKFERFDSPADQKTEAESAEKRQWRNLGIVLTVLCTLIGLLFLVGYIWLAEGEEAKPDNRSELQKMVDEYERRSK